MESSRNPFGITRKNYHLQPGEVFVTDEDMVVTTVLGSCVAVCLYDRVRRVAGINHVMLPRMSEGTEPSTRYGNVASFVLFDMMRERHCSPANMEVHVFGGANGLGRSEIEAQDSIIKVGQANVEVTLKVLQKLRLPIPEQHVGGATGRRIQFDCKTGEIRMDMLRRFDFTEELKTAVI